MDCLNNIIGIDKLCTPSVPESGLYLQNLPGITIRTADASTDEETKSGIDLINEKIKLAQSAMVQDAISFLLPKVKTKSLIESDRIGEYKENSETVASEIGYLTGKKISISNYPYIEIYIESVDIKLTSVVTDEKIFVYDLLTNTKLDEFTFTSIAGSVVNIPIKKTYKTNGHKLLLFIGYESDLSNSYKTNLRSTGCRNCSRTYSNRYVSFSDAKILAASSKIDANIISENTNGISISYSLNCSVESFICKQAKLLAWALLHKTGAELMRELQYSKRLNSIVLINGKDHIELRSEFDAEYSRSMQNVLDGLRIPSDVCFECNQKIKTIVRTP